MMIFYKRTETEEHVILTYQAYYLYLFIAALGVAAINNGYPSLGLQTITGFIWLFVFIFMMVRIISMRKVYSELRKAIKLGSVSSSGSKFNPHNPFKVTISKKPINQ